MTITNIPTAIQEHKRIAWKPITTDGDTSLTASKFSGRPWLAMGEEWPVCPNCENPMQLFLQLNFSDLPPVMKEQSGNGLLQMFYCTNSEPCCEVDCEAFFPFAESQLVRVVQSMDASEELDSTATKNGFPVKTIVGWKEADDYPNWEEGGEIGVELTDSEWESMEEYPLAGDKLGGWPHWIQGIEYPKCPICSERMALLFQLDSQDNLPYMFGDVGCGHITQCRTHRDQVAFGWACG